VLCCSSFSSRQLDYWLGGAYILHVCVLYETEVFCILFLISGHISMLLVTSNTYKEFSELYEALYSE
jgi:hypothetical protein